jgi:hypothetical protein
MSEYQHVDTSARTELGGKGSDAAEQIMEFRVPLRAGDIWTMAFEFG